MAYKISKELLKAASRLFGTLKLRNNYREDKNVSREKIDLVFTYFVNILWVI